MLFVHLSVSLLRSSFFRHNYPSDWATNWVTGSFADDWPYGIFTLQYPQDVDTAAMLSERQLAEFTMLGKFKLGQIRCWIQSYFSAWQSVACVTQYIFRSQLEYETFLKNYELNQYVYLNMVGISAFQKSSEYFLPFCHHSIFRRAMLIIWCE